MHRACVSVIGCGALGAEVCRLLALAGVGRLVVVDDDRVSHANLERSVCFTSADATTARFKVEAMRDYLAVHAPAVTLVGHAVAVETLSPDAWCESDVIVLAVDNDAARYAVNRSLLGVSAVPGSRRRALLDGAFAADFGQVRGVQYPRDTCLVCEWSPEQVGQALARQRCPAEGPCNRPPETRSRHLPAPRALPAQVAAVLVQETLSILNHGDSSLLGAQWRFAWHMDGDTEPVAVRLSRAKRVKNPSCVEPWCRECASVSASVSGDIA